MEKKYKHKRLGWIATKENQCYLTNANMGLNAVNAIPVELIENSCDWEEIIEKRDYDDVCFEVCNHLYRITKNKKASTSEYSIEEYQHGKIERANWDWNNIDENFKTRIWKEVPLEQYMAQFKKKLFTTEDGVDIYEGDKFWELNTLNFACCHFDATKDKLVPHVIPFYHKKNAEEYIMRNKVLFTTEDKVDIKLGDKYWFYDENEDKLNQRQAMYPFPNGYSHIRTKYFSTKKIAEDYIEKNKKTTVTITLSLDKEQMKDWENFLKTNNFKIEK